MDFSSWGCLGRVATFLLFVRLSAKAPAGSDQAGQFLVGALKAFAGVDLGVYE